MCVRIRFIFLRVDCIIKIFTHIIQYSCDKYWNVCLISYFMLYIFLNVRYIAMVKEWYTLKERLYFYWVMEYNSGNCVKIWTELQKCNWKDCQEKSTKKLKEKIKTLDARKIALISNKNIWWRWVANINRVQNGRILWTFYKDMTNTKIIRLRKHHELIYKVILRASCRRMGRVLHGNSPTTTHRWQEWTNVSGKYSTQYHQRLLNFDNEDKIK